MRFLKSISVLLICLLTSISYGQDISLFQQFNGRYDYTAIGNTLNPFENNIVQNFCFPLESSSADLILNPSNTVAVAFLYWAGSGPGDTTVTLNGITIEAEDTYTVNYTPNSQDTLTYFSCYANITDFIISEGNTTYEFSNLDITEPLTMLPGYCSNRTNFAGWSIYVIYEDDALPLNQINLYQGLEIINTNNQEKTIVIDNLNVIDNVGAKIGFLAWEGDNALNFGESLSINNTILSNPPLNLGDNAFNGTNSFTNAVDFYNCDLDVYDIQDNINIGDSSATITMTTGAVDDFGVFRADLIIINNIITVLNSQLPDGTIALDTYNIDCLDRTLNLDYIVSNTNSTDILPANTPIAFYVDNILLSQNATQNDIPIGGSEFNSITLTLPDTIIDLFSITLIIDDDGTGTGIVTEINENNNTYDELLQLIEVPTIQPLENQISCNEGFNSASFSLDTILEAELGIDIIADYYENLPDLEANQNEIIDPENYVNSSNPITIYAKVDAPPCYDIYEFDLSVENCPPVIPDGFSPNNDGKNDWFNIQGLYTIFEAHELKIFNRYGSLIFEGNNNTKWYGLSNRGINNVGKLVPVGTYFYILNLNEPNFEPILGWVYINY